MNGSAGIRGIFEKVQGVTVEGASDWIGFGIRTKEWKDVFVEWKGAFVGRPARPGEPMLAGK